MTQILGRNCLCIICKFGSETWGEAVYHMALEHLGFADAPVPGTMPSLELAQILTTIKLESPNYGMEVQ